MSENKMEKYTKQEKADNEEENDHSVMNGKCEQDKEANTDKDAHLPNSPKTPKSEEKMKFLPENKPHKVKSKYHMALQTLKPFIKKRRSQKQFPSEEIGMFSFMFQSYLTPFMWKTYKRGNIDVDALWDCPPREMCQKCTNKLENLWEEELDKHGPEKASLARAFYKHFQTRLWVGLLFSSISLITGFMGPTIMMRRLLEYIAPDHPTDLTYGVSIAGILFLTELARALAFSIFFVINYHSGTRAKSAMLGMLYNKVMRLRSMKDKTVGELVNLCANDSQRLFESIILAPMIVSGPPMLIAGLGYAIYTLGPWVLAGTVVFLLSYPFQVYFSKVTTQLRRKAIKITDERVQMMSEILSCIKLIKLYAWEKSFAKTISQIRLRERKVLEKASYVQTMSASFSPMIPVFAAVVTFIGHTMSGNDLSATQAFVVLAVFNLVRTRVLGPVPMAVKALAETVESMRRCTALLVMEEKKPINDEMTDTANAIEIKGATFAWDTINRETKEKTANKKKNQRKMSKSLIQENPSEQEKLTNTVQPAQTEVLYDLNISLKKGELLGVCGSVGSGKSSLLSAMLGQMITVEGHLAVHGRVAYVPQQPWVYNASVRDNILFGEPYDEKRYHQVVQQCCLDADLDVLPAGDFTEIGERGINLSGGQKQRVSLARALYCNQDIYFLDDPLSALDTHVGQSIFDEVLQGALKGKTIIFVTHQLQYLSHCDKIIMLKEGRVSEYGTHEALMGDAGEYASLIQTFYSNTSPVQAEPSVGGEGVLSESKAAVSTSSIPLSVSSSREVLNDAPASPKTVHLPDSRSFHGSKELINGTSSPPEVRIRMISMSTVSCVSGTEDEEFEKKKTGQLTEAEELEEGNISWETVKVYLKCVGGYVFSTFVLLFFGVPVGITGFSNWWLAFWVQECSKNVTVVVDNVTLYTDGHLVNHPSLHLYISIYGLTAIAVVITLCLRGFLFMKATLKASSNLHDEVFKNILRSTMSFFDTTPTGRIINRFSKDLDEVDVRLPMRMETFLQNLFLVLLCIFLVASVFPWFLVALIPLAIIFILVHKMYHVAIREIKRVDSVTRSPIVGHLTASIQGLHCITAYGKQHQEISKFHEMVDKNTVPNLLFWLCSRWIALRLDVITVTITGVVALMAVLAKGYVPSALAGLALAYAVQMTGLFQFTIRMASETEAHFTSVERIHSYSKNAVQEAPAKIPSKEPPSNWPQEGAVSFHRYSMRYRPGLPLVLSDVTCNIKPQEKIGIVGRTGAGKSSLVSALFRLIEPAEGSVTIDGLDCAKMGLEDLRSKLAVIPQDPVLFVGSVRYNLDPFGEHSDAAVWGALEKCHIKPMVKLLDNQLDAAVIENGNNFSVGERQLLCMARATLRHSKILVLDEATAAIDTETDAQIQATIRDVFDDCTTLTIAHRLHTIMECDRIMVLDSGQIVEFASPADLLADPNSRFTSMVQSSV